jgi:uncharacterized protein YprB with RNaseH-like and TPR domain
MVLMVGIAVEDADPVVIWNTTAQTWSADAEVSADEWIAGETRALRLLSSGLERYPDATIVAHNGVRFDYPFLKLRALKHAVYPLAKRLHQAKPWDVNVADTYAAISAPDRQRKGASLDGVARYLGIDRTANPISGADVYQRFVDGDLQAIEAHCTDDIRVLREIDTRLLLAGMIS